VVWSLGNRLAPNRQHCTLGSHQFQAPRPLDALHQAGLPARRSLSGGKFQRNSNAQANRVGTAAQKPHHRCRRKNPPASTKGTPGRKPCQPFGGIRPATAAEGWPVTQGSSSTAPRPPRCRACTWLRFTWAWAMRGPSRRGTAQSRLSVCTASSGVLRSSAMLKHAHGPPCRGVTDQRSPSFRVCTSQATPRQGGWHAPWAPNRPGAPPDSTTGAVPGTRQSLRGHPTPRAATAAA